MRRYLSYCRVSTRKQGETGFGLESQRQIIADYVRNGDWKCVGEYVEVESGKNDKRPQLAKALHRARMTGATLIIAKLDRLSRNVRFIAELQESKAKFLAADMPDANELSVHIFAALAAWERQMISERTKRGLAIVKQHEQDPAKRAERRERGKKAIGNPKGAKAFGRPGRGRAAGTAKIIADADRRAVDVREIIDDIKASGVTTLLGIAEELNEREVITARGGRWYATTVRNLLAR
jgi:DNA invertase Pin-like site-specific DNA recombinase